MYGAEVRLRWEEGNKKIYIKYTHNHGKAAMALYSLNIADAQQVKILPVMQETQEMWVWSLGQENSPGGGNGNIPQYSCLKNPKDREAWQATVHKVSQRVGHDWAIKCMHTSN